MLLRKIALGVLLLLGVYAASPGTDALAQSKATWRWPELGLNFEYPSNWVPRQDQNFEFLLVVPDGDSGNFLGLQSRPLVEDETLQSLFDDLAASLTSEVTELEFGGVDALAMDLPPDGNGFQGYLVGYMPDDHQIGLLIFGGQEETWETFSGQIQGIIDSAVVDVLSVDVAALDAQITTSFDADKTLHVGDPDAPIKIVEVLDFSCPHCAHYETSVKRIIQDYVVDGRVQIEFRVVTFVGRELSEVAANAQYCAASLGFGWQAHEMLFDIQLHEGAQGFTQERINESVANLEGVDAEAFAECLNNQMYADLITRDSEVSDSYEVSGTPAVLLATGDETPAFITDQNDEPVRGGVRLLSLYNHLDELLADLL